MRKIIVITLVSLSFTWSNGALAQADTTTTKKGVDIMPQYSSGETAMKTFIDANFKYPAKAKRKKIQGSVSVDFNVEADGSLSLIHVVRCRHKSLCKAAKKIVKKMPNWTPAERDNKQISYRTTVQIDYKL
jgi:TonB family protein